MLSDRAAAAKDLYRGSARIISGPWAPDSPAYDAAIPPLPFDPVAAKALLDEAGWRDSNGDGTRDRDGREFEFDLFVPAGSEIGRQVDEMLASELARAGVTARVRTHGVGGVHRARGRRRVRGRLARVVRGRPEPGPLSLLALLAVPAGRAQRRLLPQTPRPIG